MGSITHTFVSAIADDPTAAAAGEVLPSHWNATHTISLTSSDVGLGSVTNDAQTKAAIVPNTAPSAGQILAGNAGGTAYAPVSISGDATLASTGAITLKNSGVSAGSYTNANITVDAQGRVTTASNGSGGSGISSSAFGSLPAAASNSGAIYLVTDVGDSPGTLMTSNGTRWKPVNGRARLKTLGAAVTGLTNSESISLQAALSAALLAASDHIELWITGNKSGTTDSGIVTIRCGTAGTTADTSIVSVTAMTTAQLSNGAVVALKVSDATHLQRVGTQGGLNQTTAYGGGSATTLPASVAISNISNALYIDVALTSSGATNTVGLQSAYIDWITA